MVLNLKFPHRLKRLMASFCAAMLMVPNAAISQIARVPPKEIPIRAGLPDLVAHVAFNKAEIAGFNGQSVDQIYDLAEVEILVENKIKMSVFRPGLAGLVMSGTEIPNYSILIDMPLGILEQLGGIASSPGLTCVIAGSRTAIACSGEKLKAGDRALIRFSVVAVQVCGSSPPPGKVHVEAVAVPATAEVSTSNNSGTASILVASVC